MAFAMGVVFVLTRVQSYNRNSSLQLRQLVSAADPNKPDSHEEEIRLPQRNTELSEIQTGDCIFMTAGYRYRAHSVTPVPNVTFHC